MTGIRCEEHSWRMADGELLFGRHWMPAHPHGGGIYLLHGLGEHCGRYDALATWLAERGWQVRAHDHHGHGRSPGVRGTIPRSGALAEDAADLVGRFARELGRRPVLFGHSMGGALAAELVVVRRLPVAALVLSSPALDPGLNRLQRLMLAAMLRLAPGRTMRNGLDPRRISHDPTVVEAYLEDPLVHDRVSARLVAWLVAAGEAAIAAADSLSVDTLMLVAGDDALVAAQGSRRFAERAPAGRVTLRWYDGLWHEVFNERAEDRARVLADLDEWLGPRTPAAPRERAVANLSPLRRCASGRRRRGCSGR
jgi:alpha-beta hydrolase superfamily lysophospholipase